jgi:hypothetical protein
MPAPVQAAETAPAPASHATDWLKDARLGAFMHFWPNNSNEMGIVDSFDVPAVVRQLKSMGASYFVLTLGQNAGFYNSPNGAYDQFLGVAAGERCSRRDLPLDLYRALAPEGIRLMLYLPCQAPNQDGRAQRAFGLPEGKRDQPLSEEFARKWAKVIQEWSVRYGDKVSGWWFDGAYEHIRFNEAIAKIYADAVKAWNPKAIVTFNPGVRLVRWTRAEDYTTGELNDPFAVLPASRQPTGRWIQMAAGNSRERRGGHARSRAKPGSGRRPHRHFQRSPGQPVPGHSPSSIREVTRPPPYFIQVRPPDRTGCRVCGGDWPENRG